VLVAADGLQALSLVAELDEAIDLLITDVIMPKMSGPELHQQLSKTLPELPVLYISGYTGEAIAEQSAIDKDLDYLPKPFTVAEISSRIRAVLDR
jgi:DNA-binding response OmpR family regulator